MHNCQFSCLTFYVPKNFLKFYLFLPDLSLFYILSLGPKCVTSPRMTLLFSYKTKKHFNSDSKHHIYPVRKKELCLIYTVYHLNIKSCFKTFYE